MTMFTEIVGLKRRKEMFWNKIKSKEYTELLEIIQRQQNKILSLELDLGLYVRKLKAAKGLDKKEEEEPEPAKDIYGGMFLPEDGNNQKFRKK